MVTQSRVAPSASESRYAVLLMARLFDRMLIAVDKALIEPSLLEAQQEYRSRAYPRTDGLSLEGIFRLRLLNCSQVHSDPACTAIGGRGCSMRAYGATTGIGSPG